MTGPAFAGAAGAAIIEAAAFTAGLGKVGTTPCACTGSVAGTLGEAAGDEVVDDGSDREDEEAPDA